MSRGRSTPGAVLWLTGLSGAGKSTIARGVCDRLVAAGRDVELLDGDEVRTILSKGLGFSKEDRDLNILRIAFVATLLVRRGTIVIAAAISPYAEARADARRRVESAHAAFVEVFVTAPIDVLIARDAKGLYRRALAGEITGFTGISDPYEPPAHPELVVETHRESVDESVGRVWSALERAGVFSHL